MDTRLLMPDAVSIPVDQASYVACQAQVDSVYRNPEQWTRMSILNTARSGFFSSYRAIRQYCQEMWKVTPVPVPLR